MFRYRILFSLVLISKTLFAQTGFYNIDSIREIRVYFNEPNWDHLLDSLYIEGGENRLLCSVSIDGANYDSVGIRYKGFSSVSVNRIKNPFNIKLDYIINDQNHRGHNKIKLSNVIQDPSFLREVLSYEIGRKYMPCSEANFANIYINDTLWGLYTNVEAVNKDFLSKHYSSRENPFIKCNPEHLNLNGENSNLGDSPGTDSSSYYPYYDLKSDYGWSDLYSLIDTLNNFPDSIENILNVDRTLWMHALNYALVNIDSYIGYAQNYYLYKDNNGRFNPILWDLNMSFGSFRFTDASLFYNGFNINEAKTIDPLSHVNSVSVYPRPLIRNLLTNDQYKRMYIAHLRTIMEENFTNQDYYNRAFYFQALTNIHVLNDTNKFYSWADFLNNLNNTVTDLIDYPGITELMNPRDSFLANYPGVLGAPIIDSINYSPQNFTLGDTVWINANISGASTVLLASRFASNERFVKKDMYDDGLHNDGVANDGIYGGMILNSSNNIQYYIYAENDSSGRFSPKRAAYEYHLIQNQLGNGDVVINEVMSNNETTVADQSGDYDDWIELYNPTFSDVSMAGLYLSDDSSNLKKWPLPDQTIASNNYLIIWADKDSDQNGIHANFKISAAGEALFLSYDSLSIIDSVKIPELAADIGFARLPNGYGPFAKHTPSFNANNDFAENYELFNIKFKCYPNPSKNKIRVQYEMNTSGSLKLLNIEGKTLIDQKIPLGNQTIEIDTHKLKKGIYFINLYSNTASLTKKIIKL
ncbi:MAG: hypothetical protein CL824_06000 [Crocinitomicaceae bacterium]|nr:hypothetical protein [Crocinitomicaceae bacterium]